MAIYVPQASAFAPFLARQPLTERGPDSLRFGDYAPFPLTDMDLIIETALPT
ncbi:MAG: hypothetical protein ACOCXA_09100 [Planctomycetota bacterium]